MARVAGRVQEVALEVYAMSRQRRSPKMIFDQGVT